MNKNGSVSTQITPIQEEKEEPVAQSSEEKVSDKGETESNGFADNLLKIQKAASQLVAIQQVVKASGRITEEEKKVYADNLNSLGLAAQELSKMNEGKEDDDFRRLITGGEWTETMRGGLFTDVFPFPRRREEGQTIDEEEVPRLPALQGGGKGRRGRGEHWGTLQWVR